MISASRCSPVAWPAALVFAARSKTVQSLRVVSASHILLLLLLWSAISSRAGDSGQLEPSPLRENAAQQEWLRAKAKEKQELHRMRVVLPPTVWAGNQAALAAAPEPTDQAQAMGGLSQGVPPLGRGVLLGMLLCLAGWMAWRTLSPAKAQAAVRNSVAPVSASGTRPGGAAEILSEEQASAQFLAAFRAGPSPRPEPPVGPVKPAVVAAGNPGNLSCGGERPSVQRFFASVPDRLVAMRHALQTVRRESNDSAQRELLGDLRARLCTVKESASMPELLSIWQVLSATEALVSQLTNPNRLVTPNTLRTVASSLDLLVELCAHCPKPQLWDPPIRILAVDDDLISRHAVALALRKAFNQPDLAANSEAAFAQASMINYDVIFLDILMPGMDGFELCSKIRQTSANLLTPVVFVTSQTELDARAKSSLSGGNDFITKPFLTFEVAVKALVLAIRCRLAKQAKALAVGPVACSA
jgi:CheY-like chemotaxis protein